MHPGTDLKDMLKEIQEIGNNQKDYLLHPDTSIQIKNDLKMEIQSIGEFELGEVAHEQFADRMGIPRKYYNKMHAMAPELLASNLNHWIKEDSNNRMIRTSQNKCRAFLSNRFFAIDNSVVAALVIPKLLKMGADVKSCQLTERKLYIQAIYPSMEEEIKNNDIVNAGICISNSDVGCGSCKIEPLVYRLVCSNGLISKVSLKKYHVGSLMESNSDMPDEVISDNTRRLKIEAITSEISDVIDFSFNDDFFIGEVNKLKEATGRKIESGHLEPVVKNVSSRFNLLKHESEETLHRLIEGLDISQYGLANSITSMANDISNYDRAIDLEKIGGQVAFLDDNEWGAVANM